MDALAHGRLLVAVSAVLEDTDESGEEKSSHMAVVSMINAAGEKGLLAFTGVDSMTAWDPAARPVPATGAGCARAALEDGAVALVIDVSGPSPLALALSVVRALAARG